MVGVTVDGAKGVGAVVGLVGVVGVVRCCHARFKQPNSWEQDLHVSRFFFIYHRKESLKYFSFGVWAWSFGGYCGEVLVFSSCFLRVLLQVAHLSIWPRTAIQRCGLASSKACRYCVIEVVNKPYTRLHTPELKAAGLRVATQTIDSLIFTVLSWQPGNDTSLGLHRGTPEVWLWRRLEVCSVPQGDDAFGMLGLRHWRRKVFGHLGLRSHWSKWIILLHHLLWNTPPCCTCRRRWGDVFTKRQLAY